ncbi:MAG: primosomal protein N', partial [Pseudomonadota bacterium]
MESLLTYAEPGSAALLSRVPVLVPMLLDTTFDYLLPADIDAPPGTFVRVPFGAQERMGVVWRTSLDPAKTAGDVDPTKLKEIIRAADVPPLPDVSMRFAEWVARYTLTPIGMVVRLMMSARAAFEPQRPRIGVRMVADPPSRMTPGRERAIAAAQDGKPRPKAELAAAAGVSGAVIDGLVKAGCFVAAELPPARFPEPDPDHTAPTFAPAQAAAVAQLRNAVGKGTFDVNLLDGVTGSGKTEVYFEAAAEAMRQGRQVLILLPEIALTGQFVARFEARFGCRPLEWHSAVSQGERGRIWRAVATGEARAIIGARSALFLPFDNLGCIIVDEEHESAFKQEDRVLYQARDMAVVRASLGKAAVVLASATPSIESQVNAREKKYRHVHLTERYSDAELPEITAIDLRRDPPPRGRWLSPVLVEAVTQAITAGEQALLFLNRRGYAPLTLCRACGHRIDCPQCSAYLVEHRFRGRLTCHHCAFTMPLPRVCPKCQEQDTMIPCGPGVERVAEEVREIWPEARLAILSSDLTPGVTEMRGILDAIARGEADIIIGTQIVAKGHHFPGLSTVGVVDGDLGLGQADPRAAERTFQLLAQVTGRAGRTSTEGRGFIQTHLPEHPVMQATVLGDRELFLEREIEQRRAAGYPPFGRLAALIVTARDKLAADTYAREIVRAAPAARSIMVLGPVEAPIAVIRGRHRFRVLVKAPREIDLQAYLRAWLEAAPPARGDLRLSVSTDKRR